MRKQEFLVPVVIVLRALRDISDQEFYDRYINLSHISLHWWLACFERQKPNRQIKPNHFQGHGTRHI